MANITIDELPPFATPLDLSNYTNGQIQEEDDRCEPVLAAVSASIRREAGWHIWPVVQGHELVLDGPGGRKLALPTMNLVDLQSISELGQNLDIEQGVDWSEIGLVMKVNGLWTNRYRKIRATVTHGYPEAADLAWLACSLAARGLSSPMGATREQAGAIAITWATPQSGVGGGLVPLASEQAVMDRYKLVVA